MKTRFINYFFRLDENGIRSPKLSLFLIVVLLMSLAWWSSWEILVGRYDSYEIRGQFGDTFGAVNSLFSGLAFATLIYTMFLQRSDLQLTREEVKKSNVQLEKQANIIQEQLELSHLPFFEVSNYTMSGVTLVNTGKPAFDVKVIINQFPVDMKSDTIKHRLMQGYIKTGEPINVGYIPEGMMSVQYIRYDITLNYKSLAKVKYVQNIHLDVEAEFSNTNEPPTKVRN